MALSYPAVWDRREDTIFENCLVEIPDSVEDRWHLIARRIPGKSPEDVMDHYETLLFDVRQIDSGLVEMPSYPDETATDPDPGPGGNKHVEVKRKKGAPWTELEHRLLLVGLKRYGRGEWTNISKYVVLTKTPTQVASHAQKYFLRQNDTRNKRRTSIHDISTTIDSLTVPAQPNLPVPDEAEVQSDHFDEDSL